MELRKRKQKKISGILFLFVSVACYCGLCMPNMSVTKANAKENLGEFICLPPKKKTFSRFSFVIISVRKVLIGQEKTNKHKHFRRDGLRDKQEPSLGQMGPLPGTKWDPSLGQTGLSLFNSTVKSPFCPVCPWDGWRFVAVRKMFMCFLFIGFFCSQLSANILQTNYPIHCPRYPFVRGILGILSSFSMSSFPSCVLGSVTHTVFTIVLAIGHPPIPGCRD